MLLLHGILVGPGAGVVVELLPTCVEELLPTCVVTVKFLLAGVVVGTPPIAVTESPWLVVVVSGGVVEEAELGLRLLIAHACLFCPPGAANCWPWAGSHAAVRLPRS